MTSIHKIILYIGIGCLFACNKINTNIYNNIPFEGIASKAVSEDSPFCIVLMDSSQNASIEYLQHLQVNYKCLTEKAIYNIVNINTEEGEWYKKWLLPVSIPLTCVFSPEGSLIDLIPGVSKETFLYTEQAIKHLSTTGFHWPNRFQMNKKRAIPLLNKLLEQKRYLDNGIYSKSDIEPLTDSLNYPYAVYLMLSGELMLNDTMASQSVAKELMELETPSSLDIFRTEFITAKKVLEPDFDIALEPNIRVNTTSIKLNDCIMNERVPLNLTIYNEGAKPLKISKIHVSCSCLESVGEDSDIIINANDSLIAKFYFTPDTEGEIQRDIFITSNAINIPILYIDVLANAVNNTKN